jgi:hypothetical protein
MTKKLFATFLLLAMVLSCGEEAYRNTIPYARVNFIINLNGADHELNNLLAFKVYTDEDRRRNDDRMGYAGLLVVTGAEGMLYAYDCCCPFEDSKEVRVEPDSNGTARCSHCGSIFRTIFGLGTPESGPATEPLQIYRVIDLQNGTFQIIN